MGEVRSAQVPRRLSCWLSPRIFNVNVNVSNSPLTGHETKDKIVNESGQPVTPEVVIGD